MVSDFDIDHGENGELDCWVDNEGCVGVVQVSKPGSRGILERDDAASISLNREELIKLKNWLNLAIEQVIDCEMLKSEQLEWKVHSITGDCFADTKFGQYLCVKNPHNVSILWKSGRKLGEFGVGGHDKAKKAAWDHYHTQLKLSENS